MLKLIAKLPDHVVGVTASGEIDAKDYETILMPALVAALARHKRVRLLYQLTPEFTGFTAGAMWDDMRVGLEHLKAWERIAVVTDLPWLANATRMFAFVMPGMVKVFTNAEFADAEKWITA